MIILVFTNVEKICQSTNERACTASYFIKELSMNIELKYPNLSQQVTQYVQELQIFKNAYQRLNTNDNNSDCAKIANENISARTEEKQSGNTDDGHNNYEINLSVNN